MTGAGPSPRPAGPPPGLLLGIDVGTTATKALLLDRAGTVVARSRVPTPFRTASGATEMTVAALAAALREGLGGLGPALDRVAAAAVTGMAECGAPLDRRGRPLAPVIAWHDPRGQATVDRLRERFGDELDRRTGRRLRTVSSVAKLGWLADHGVCAVHRWLGVPELVLWLLTGACATEHSLASRTGCYDVVGRAYLPDVARAAGFDPGVLAPVLAAGRPMGRVSGAGARWSGLAAGVPVTLAGHDHLAAAEAVGDDDDEVDSVGTAEAVVRRTARPPDAAQALALGAAVSVAPGGRGWAVMASVARAGAILSALSGHLEAGAAELDALAAGAPGPVPGDVSRAARALVEGWGGEPPPSPPPGPRGLVWRAVACALAARWAQRSRALAGLAGPPARVIAVGGGTRGTVLMAEKAAVAPAPLLRCAVVEAAAQGAALCAGVAAGWWTSPREGPRPTLEPVGPAGSPA